MTHTNKRHAIKQKKRQVMQHTIRQSTGYITHVYIQVVTIRMNSEKSTMLKKTIKGIYNPENRHVKSNDIQQRIHTCKAIKIIMEKIKITMLSKTKWAINTINMSISQTNIAMKHKKNSYLGILNQDKSIIITNISMSQNEYNIQACIQWYQELSMCNQEIGTHWSTHQTPHLLHLKFKLDPLKDP